MAVEYNVPARSLGLLVDKFVFFFHAIPPDVACMTLEELHTLVRDVWLARHDPELEQERAARRKGRPPSAREFALEQIKQHEAEEYRTGIGASYSRISVTATNTLVELPDLTHTANVTLFRRWDEMEAAFIEQLRFIRISSDKPDHVAVSRPGKHSTLQTKADASQMDTSA